MPRPLKPFFAENGIEIYHGDCLEILPRLTAKKFDLVLTDPPYLFKAGVGGGGLKAKIFDDPKFLTMCNFDPQAFLAGVAELQPRLNLVATCSRDLVPLYARMALEARWEFDVHVWHKPNAPPFTHGTFKSDVEYITLLYKLPRPFRQGYPSAHYSKVFTHGTMRGKKYHVTQKPLELMKKYASILCPVGGRLLDPFMGSGTTLVAAQELGLSAVGIERDKSDCKNAVDRLRAARKE